MKNLLGIFLSLSIVCLISVQAGADDESNAVVLQKEQPVAPSQPSPKTKSSSNSNTSQNNGMSGLPTVEDLKNQEHLTVQQWGDNNETAKEIKQYSQQTKEEMADFSKF